MALFRRFPFFRPFRANWCRIGVTPARQFAAECRAVGANMGGVRPRNQPIHPESYLERFRLMRSGVPGVADVVPALVGCERVVDRAEEALDLVDGA